jgi:hypothetical protein
VTYSGFSLRSTKLGTWAIFKDCKLLGYRGTFTEAIERIKILKVRVPQGYTEYGPWQSFEHEGETVHFRTSRFVPFLPQPKMPEYRLKVRDAPSTLG